MQVAATPERFINIQFLYAVARRKARGGGGGAVWEAGTVGNFTSGDVSPGPDGAGPVPDWILHGPRSGAG